MLYYVLVACVNKRERLCEENVKYYYDTVRRLFSTSSLAEDTKGGWLFVRSAIPQHEKNKTAACTPQWNFGTLPQANETGACTGTSSQEFPRGVHAKGSS